MRIALESAPLPPCPSSRPSLFANPGDDASFRSLLRDGIVRLASNESLVARSVTEVASSKPASQLELLALQASVYRYSQELELASRLVDRATSAVRQTLQAQT